MAGAGEPWVVLLVERIETIGLSIRCYRHLKQHGVNTVLDLLYAPDSILEPYFDEVRVGLIRLARLRRSEDSG